MPRGIRTEDTVTLQMALVGYEIEKQKIEERIREVQAALGGSEAPAAGAAEPKRRKMSLAARRRIGAAQKRRWAEHRKKTAKG
jgi:hypothetical protein